MNPKDDSIKRALGLLQQESIPTKQQKDSMLDHILMECREEQTSSIGRLKNMIITYPWRVAFVASVAQAAVFTTIFGTQYTNLFLKIFGG